MTPEERKALKEAVHDLARGLAMLAAAVANDGLKPGSPDAEYIAACVTSAEKALERLG